MGRRVAHGKSGRGLPRAEAEVGLDLKLGLGLVEPFLDSSPEASVQH